MGSRLMWQRLSQLICVAALFALTASSCEATVVVMDFNEQGGRCCLGTPYFEDGFEITLLAPPVSLHYDLIDSCLPPGTSDNVSTIDCTPFFGWDSSGAGIHFQLDFFGRPFSILGFDITCLPPSGFITSSSGGLESINTFTCNPNIPGQGQIQLITGNEWRNILWVHIGGEGGPGKPWGIDNIRLEFSMPEPMPLALIAFGLAGLAFIRRRKPVVKRDI